MIRVAEENYLWSAGERCNNCKEKSERLIPFDIVNSIKILCPCCSRKLMNVIRREIEND